MVKLIAEFCQNHNGDFNLLAKMVEKASLSGASYGKMQNIFADTITYRPQFEHGLIEDGVIKAIKRPYSDEYKRLKAEADVKYAEYVGLSIELDRIEDLTPKLSLGGILGGN